MHDFAHEATHEFLHLDGKIINTVKLLVLKPGELTREFVAGRRARYISPLRVYLTFSLLFFFLAAIAPRSEGIMQIGTGASAAAENAKEEREAEAIGHALQTNLPRLMFVLMPAFGLLTLAFWRRSQPYYVPHLYFSVHLHAFVFLLFSIATLIGFAGRTGKTIGSVVALAMVPYYFLALRRFFAESWQKTLWKGTAAGVVYAVAIVALMAALVAVTIN